MMLVTGSAFKDILGIIIALVVITVAYFKWSFAYWRRKGVQHPRPSIPFGTVAGLFGQKNSIGEIFRDAYRSYKDEGYKYCGLYFFSSPIFVPIDLDLIKAMMTKDFDHFTDHNSYVNEEKEPLTGGLFNLKGSKWKNVRAKLTPTFTSGKMKMMFRTLVDCSHGLIEVVHKAVERKEVLDIKDAVSRYTTDVIGSCAFGLECNSLKNPDSEFRSYAKKLAQANKMQILGRILSLSFPGLVDKFGLTLFDKEVSKFFMKVVKQTVDYREKNNIVRKDFMHMLIELKNSTNIEDEDLEDTSNAGKALTLSEVAAHAFVFFVAGFETSSTTLTFCFYELAINADIQEKLRKEIKDVLGKYQGELTYDALMEMHYMDKCIQETLRKYPALPFLVRECTKKYHVPDSDLVIEKGMLAFISILGIQRDPEYYPEPEKFDPERFSPENRAKRHHFTWLPFGEGPRACIGLRFGTMQIKVALAVLLKNYKFTLNARTRTPFAFKFNTAILSVQGEVWLNAEKAIAL